MKVLCTVLVVLIFACAAIAMPTSKTSVVPEQSVSFQPTLPTAAPLPVAFGPLPPPFPNGCTWFNPNCKQPQPQPPTFTAPTVADDNCFINRDGVLICGGGGSRPPVGETLMAGPLPPPYPNGCPPTGPPHCNLPPVLF